MASQLAPRMSFLLPMGVCYGCIIYRVPSLPQILVFLAIAIIFVAGLLLGRYTAPTCMYLLMFFACLFACLFVCLFVCLFICFVGGFGGGSGMAF